jgi:uncharacterized membrane protein
MTTVALVAILGAVFLGIVAALVWQEAKKRGFDDGPAYVVEDAVAFIVPRLDEDTRTRLRTSDVRRIVQWEVHYLQGLAQDDRRTPVETVAGGAPAAVDYIADEIAARHGVTYAHDDIRRVLRHEAEYLVAIGAVGDQVSDGGEPR